jgi:hypothetical protein
VRLPPKIEWSARFLGIEVDAAFEIVAKIDTSPSRQDAAALVLPRHGFMTTAAVPSAADVR